MSNLLARYRRHYQIPDDVPLSYDDLRRHLVVELEITSRLLASTPEERPAVFAEGYDRIYRELWWFNAAEDASGSDVDITNWVAMIGPPPRAFWRSAPAKARWRDRSGEPVMPSRRRTSARPAGPSAATQTGCPGARRTACI